MPASSITAKLRKQYTDSAETSGAPPSPNRPPRLAKAWGRLSASNRTNPNRTKKFTYRWDSPLHMFNYSNHCGQDFICPTKKSPCYGGFFSLARHSSCLIPDLFSPKRMYAVFCMYHCLSCSVPVRSVSVFLSVH